MSTSDDLGLVRDFLAEFTADNSVIIPALRQGVVTAWSPSEQAYTVSFAGGTSVSKIKSLADNLIANGSTVWVIRYGGIMLILGKQYTGA